MKHRLDCVVGGGELSVLFDDPIDLAEYADGLCLRPVATYRNGAMAVHQYFEPDFDAMGLEERLSYSMLLGLPSREGNLSGGLAVPGER